MLSLAAPIVDSLMKGELVDRTAAAPPTRAPEPPAFADDEYITGAQLRQMMASGRDTSALDLAASANVSITESRHAADFAKYGNEIRALVAQVPSNMRTIDNLERVVKMVRSDHIDEIAQERASQLVASMPATLRSNGASSSGSVDQQSSLESEKIPAEWKRRAVAAGVTERVVDEFCRANDMTVEAFYKQFDTPMNRIVEDTPQRRQG